MRFEFDAFDVMAFVAILLVLAGLAVWHWPAALVALGCGLLAVYYIRETRFMPEKPQPDEEK